MPEIYVDADACPVKEEIVKVALRHNLKTYLVSDGGIRPHPSPLVVIVTVAPGPDAADDWIAMHIEFGDIVITSDIPLADRCLKKDAAAIRPDGKVFTPDSIGMAMAMRDLMANLRSSGDVSGGPPPFSRQDRSNFLQALETAIQTRHS